MLHVSYDANYSSPRHQFNSSNVTTEFTHEIIRSSKASYIPSNVSELINAVISNQVIDRMIKNQQKLFNIELKSMMPFFFYAMKRCIYRSLQKKKIPRRFSTTQKNSEKCPETCQRWPFGRHDDVKYTIRISIVSEQV